jgi:hypothetical protein
VHEGGIEVGKKSMKAIDEVGKKTIGSALI